MAEGLEKFTQRFFRSREAAQEQAELLRLLEEMREVQEKLLRFVEGASPLSEAELRSQFYKWYEEFVKEPIRPGSELWRPVEELVERYNWYVRQFGRGVELPLGAGMKELRRAAEELSHELYATKLSTREVGELFTRRAELTRQLYEMATSSTKVRRALKSIGLIPVTWSTEELFARAAEGFLDEENFFAYFAFHTRRGKTEALLARYFPYDFPRYPEFIRRLERAQPGLGEAWVQRYAPAERIAIRGYRYGSLARFEPRLALVRTGSGGLEPRWIEAPREIRDIFQEMAPEVEVGVPPTAPTSPTSLKAVARQERAGFYVREALVELEERKYFSRYFPRGASEFDRLRARLLRAKEPEADIARVLDYVGRELVELRTGT
ncbi:MAG: hypothetical protein H5U03_03600, partial [Clostridia bacterium]|nr:hypothetical protein [Clostridia bacterium]